MSLCFILQSFGQSSISKNENPSANCKAIIDSLTKTGYFRKGKQVDLQDLPTRAYIAFYNLEILYSGGEGYIVKSNRNSSYWYTTFKGTTFLTSLISAMNENYMFDSTFMILDPNYIVVTGKAGISMKIDITLTSGQIIKNEISSDGIYGYYTYLGKFIQYLQGIRNSSYEQLDLNIAFYLKSKFNSEIANQFIRDVENAPLIMEPKKLDINSKMEIKKVGDSKEFNY